MARDFIGEAIVTSIQGGNVKAALDTAFKNCSELLKEERASGDAQPALNGDDGERLGRPRKPFRIEPARYIDRRQSFFSAAALLLVFSLAIYPIFYTLMISTRN